MNSRKGSANHPESGQRLATMAKIIPQALMAATRPEVDQVFGSFLHCERTLIESISAASSRLTSGFAWGGTVATPRAG